MATEVKVPTLGESITEATLVNWHKKAGDTVKRDENLIDIETGKVANRRTFSGEAYGAVAISNINAPTQHVIAGAEAAVLCGAGPARAGCGAHS